MSLDDSRQDVSLHLHYKSHSKTSIRKTRFLHPAVSNVYSGLQLDAATQAKLVCQYRLR